MLRNAVAATLLVALAFVPRADAATITVNTTADGAPANDGTCTLREAIVASNTDTASGGTAGECAAGSGTDTIAFAANFNGELADTITHVGVAQTITQAVAIAGGDCGTAGSPKPCVGVDAAGDLGFRINADDVSVAGVAITNAIDGINAVDAAGDGLVVRNSWFGLELDGTTASINTSDGILSSHSGATIGGTTAADRNVFARNGVGVRLVGGDDNAVQGNYFGTEPDGDANAGLGNSIANVQVLGNLASGVPLNTTIGGPDAGTPTVCDGACNLLAPAGTTNSIDLVASEAPAGETAIAGNFVGVGLAGAQLGAGPSAIAIGGADDVTVGGAGSASRNYIGRGGVSAGAGATNAIIQGNSIGLNPAGTARIGQGGEVSLTDGATGVQVLGNRIAQDSNNAGAITINNSPSNIVRGNVVGIGAGNQDVGGGTVAINVFGDAADANLIGGAGAGDGNTIGNTGGAAVNIFDADSNVVQGNRIGTDAGEVADFGYPGVGVEISGTGATSNVVGGTTAASENVISNITASFQAGDGIRVASDGNDNNQVLRNRGTNNAGLFVDLGPNGFGNGPSEANDDIAAPTVNAGASGTLVSGTGARPGATVRVYRTATAAGGDPNDLVGFAGQTVADGSGDWTLPCPSTDCATALPGAGQVTANQTDPSGNSSEFAKSVSYADTPPDTTIDSGPAEGSTIDDATPEFAFSSSEPDSTFECRVDGAPFTACASPHTTTPLAAGSHTFEVRAVDSTSNPDPTPQTRGFTVVEPPPPPPPPPSGGGADTDPPETTIDKAPKRKSFKRKAKFAFSSDEPGSTFECKLDKGKLKPCGARAKFKVKPGKHRLEVRATDTAGNTDPTPGRATWTVKRRR